MDKVRCWLFGHKPLKPVVVSGMFVLYQCKRCKRLIRFSPEKGWMVWKNVGE